MRWSCSGRWDWRGCVNGGRRRHRRRSWDWRRRSSMSGSRRRSWDWRRRSSLSGSRRRSWDWRGCSSGSGGQRWRQDWRGRESGRRRRSWDRMNGGQCWCGRSCLHGCRRRYRRSCLSGSRNWRRCVGGGWRRSRDWRGCVGGGRRLGGPRHSGRRYLGQHRRADIRRRRRGVSDSWRRRECRFGSRRNRG